MHSNIIWTLVLCPENIDLGKLLDIICTQPMQWWMIESTNWKVSEQKLPFVSFYMQYNVKRKAAFCFIYIKQCACMHTHTIFYLKLGNVLSITEFWHLESICDIYTNMIYFCNSNTPSLWPWRLLYKHIW